MVLQLTFNEFLQLREAQGAAIEVLEGKVWITEDGGRSDRFLESGRSYQVAGQGLVIVGADAQGKNAAHFARVKVQRSAKPFSAHILSFFRRFLARLEAHSTRRELRGLDDRMLRDIGLSRHEIDAMRDRF